jgi:DNA repair protein RecO (recombination protein O)
MGLVETEALVLKSYSLAEADKIVVFLTQTQGLVRGVARGAKRLKSRFGSGLEPFSFVQLTYFQKEDRELVSINNIELTKTFFEYASEPLFLQKFAYLAELLNEFAPPHEPNEKLYRMAKVCLESAAQNPEYLENIALYFELWILRLGGYLPNWERCDSCKREFIQNEPSNLQINFHLFCRNCQKSRNGWEVSSLERKIFLQAQKFSPEKFVELTKDRREDVLNVSNILKRIISNILGKETIGEKTLFAGSQI